MDDAFTARPGFPTGLEPRYRRCRRRKPKEPPGRPGGSNSLSATGSAELREWSPPSGTDVFGRVQAVGPSHEATAGEAEARTAARWGLVRRGLVFAEMRHDVVPWRMKRATLADW